VDVTYRVGAQASTASGVGYHDHNWGNTLINSLINHWYWARGQAGPYTTIASYITAEDKYGNTELPIFMLAREGRVVADDGTRVTFEELGTFTDTATGKPRGVITTLTAGGTWPQTGCSSMTLDTSGQFLLVPSSLHQPAPPGTDVLQHVARINIATKAMSTVPVRMPGSGGMDQESGMSILAW